MTAKVVEKLKDRFALSRESKRAVKNTHWLLSEKLVSMPVGLITSVLLARHLGVEQLGLYSYLLSVAMLVTPLATMGLSSLITRELVNEHDHRYSVMGAAFLVRLFGGLLGLGVLSLYGMTESAQNAQWLMLIGVAQVFSCMTFIDFWFQSRVQVQYSVMARTFALFAIFSMRLAAIWFEAELSIFVWLYGAELIVSALSYLTVYRLRGERLVDWQLDGRRAISMVKQSWLLILSGFAAMVYLKIDMVMLTRMTTLEQAGLYSVASRISEIWYFIPIAVVSSFFPMLLKLRNTSHEHYHKKLQVLCDLLFAMAVAVVVPVILLSESVMVIVFGDEYRQAAPVLSIHILAGVFIFMRALFSKWLIAEGLLKFSLVTQLAGALVNVALNALLIPHYESMGAAWATLISYACASYFALFFSSHTRPMAFIMSRSLLLPFRAGSYFRRG
ncbi:hypothetical protein HMF8227_00744 [Saliniradius amylolyticus]|uniref:Uncharacterized protein n=1 Tax=Saliniradius amylolyticus TaxID=2183582 RepID=A0A2S2E1V4_9ALTE|nr:flippase [Saliniradius amylolyticus]AWL11240.1 hypothetical protein HMF8227_00744 [Saliniradius amylolyticus]